MHRILHVIESWGPGGAETVFTELAGGLSPGEFESVAILSRAQNWVYDEVRRRGLDPIIIPTSGAFDLHYLWRLVQTIRRTNASLVQAHTFGTGVYASAAGRICRVPVVCTFHGRIDVAAADPRRGVKVAVLARRASRVVCVSESLRQEVLAAGGLPAAQVDVIFNGVDTERFRPGQAAALRVSLGVAPGELLIGAVGNLRAAKGYEVLMAAVANLVRRGLPCRAVIVGLGGGAVEEQLEAQHAQLGLGDRLQFVGFRDNPEEFYRAFDTYVLTSHTEGFSLSTVQALASGLPVVATRCGGPEEIISDGADGLLVAPGSAEAVADAIERVFGDPALRAHLVAAARQTAVERFSTAAMIAKYERLYRSLLSTFA